MAADLAALAVIWVLFAWLLSPAVAGPCRAGFVPRQSAPADGICVLPASRDLVVAENSRAVVLWLSGAFGPKTCAQGYVWREAFTGDLVCVTPDRRGAVADENQLDPSRREP
ncbi:hypothetical protein [Microvirga sp. TS319]|uniref:hypothetical protein n=1 Tax=Microvirga sp. TS319 TaxID=3241165 RepID=UPI003519E4D7